MLKKKKISILLSIFKDVWSILININDKDLIKKRDYKQLIINNRIDFLNLPLFFGMRPMKAAFDLYNRLVLV